jgi:hypothetical protein
MTQKEHHVISTLRSFHSHDSRNSWFEPAFLSLSSTLTLTGEASGFPSMTPYQPRLRRWIKLLTITLFSLITPSCRQQSTELFRLEPDGHLKYLDPTSNMEGPIPKNWEGSRTSNQPATLIVPRESGIKALNSAISELGRHGIPNLKLQSSWDSSLCPIFEYALSDGYESHWQYALEVKTSHLPPDQHSGYDEPSRITYAIVSISGKKVLFADHPASPDDIRRTLKSITPNLQRCAVIILPSESLDMETLLSFMQEMEHDGIKLILHEIQKSSTPKSSGNR